MMQLDNSAPVVNGGGCGSYTRLAHAQIRPSQFIELGNTLFSKGKNEEDTPDGQVLAAQKLGS
jgi:hypothetical protein